MTDTELDNAIQALLTTGGRTLADLLQHATNVNAQLDNSNAPTLPTIPANTWTDLKNWILDGKSGGEFRRYAVAAYNAFNNDDQRAAIISTFLMLKVAISVYGVRS